MNYSRYKALRAYSIGVSYRTNSTAADNVERESHKTHFGFQTVDEDEKQQKG